MEGATLILESQATDRLLREPHLDHGSQEGAFTASDVNELIGYSSQDTFPKGAEEMVTKPPRG